jgi:CO/xanthine dehydrogenase FAD-binding subunit
VKAFDYVRPSSVEEACSALTAADGQVKVLAGGTDVLVQMRLGTLQPQTLVSLRDVPDLAMVRLEDDGALTIGAATTLGAVENAPAVRGSFPAIGEAAACIGSVQVRSRATVGGNLCNAAPSADMAPILLVYEAEAIITDGRAERSVPLEKFFIGPGETVLGPGELLKALRVPPLPPESHAKYYKTFRSAMDCCTVGVAVAAVFTPGTTSLSDVRLALGAVAPTPVRARRAERMALDQPLDEGLIERVSAQAAAEAWPISDVRASAEYRTTLVEVLTRRALKGALSWAEQGGRG